MSATRILWGQILAVFLIILTGVWAATQYIAWRLGFQEGLGTPWFELAGWPVYYPPAFFWWWYLFDAYAPDIFVRGGLIAASGGIASIAVAIAMSVWRAREARKVETYGSARWASRDEVRAARLLGADGVVLGKLGGDYLRHDGPEHVLCFAPIRDCCTGAGTVNTANGCPLHGGRPGLRQNPTAIVSGNYLAIKFLANESVRCRPIRTTELTVSVDTQNSAEFRTMERALALENLDNRANRTFQFQQLGYE